MNRAVPELVRGSDAAARLGLGLFVEADPDDEPYHYGPICECHAGLHPQNPLRCRLEAI